MQSSEELDQNSPCEVKITSRLVGKQPGDGARGRIDSGRWRVDELVHSRAERASESMRDEYGGGHEPELDAREVLLTDSGAPGETALREASASTPSSDGAAEQDSERAEVHAYLYGHHEGFDKSKSPWRVVRIDPPGGAPVRSRSGTAP